MREILNIGSYLILFLLFGFLISCSKDKDYIDEVDGEYISLSCLTSKTGTYIIKTEEAYFNMVRQIYNDNVPYIYDCVDTTKVPFDFNEFILLGKYTNHDINDDFKRRILIDKSAQCVTYKIEKYVVANPNNGGFGVIQASGMNWLKISKPPEGYKIKIDYKIYR